jgi:hypothetical protein
VTELHCKLLTFLKTAPRGKLKQADLHWLLGAHRATGDHPEIPGRYV